VNEPTDVTPVPVTDPLSIVALETERHVAGFGWDQPPRLFALVPTAQMIADEPGLAEQLGGSDLLPGALTAIEQDELPTTSDVVELLAQIGWPPEVAGAAFAVERIVVPPDAERDLPEDPAQAVQVLADHPDRADVRLVVAVLRDGPAVCLLRQRAHDRDDRVASGPDIAPGLVHALRATLSD
jgi:hypothetical protein